MRYDDPKLLDALAREYVVGTLRGRARERFGRILSSSLVARRLVGDWERRFTPLVGAVKPVEPPRAAWSGIEAALGMRRRTRSAATWPALAASLALVALVFGTLYFGELRVEQPRYVAVVTDPTTGPVWLLQAFAGARELRARAINDRPAPVGNAYELWMLPDGAAPVSLGLVAGVGDTELALTDAQLAVLAQTSTLAISLEPAGGSPTGQPTGPVIFTAPLLRA